jgi:hypothetical protein
MVKDDGGDGGEPRSDRVSAMSDEVVIDRRFRGPPDSANGGYACGLLAAFVKGGPAVEVTLREPPPLDAPLAVEAANGSARLLDGDSLVAEGRAVDAPELAVPDPGSPMHSEHPYPSCFVCSSERAPGDGLRITCGPVPGREAELVAAPFEIDGDLAGADGNVRPELVWSVLDCPSGIAGMLVPEQGISVLGRLTARLLRPVPAGATHVAIGWPTGRDGRKHYSATAILDRDGQTLALASATWIELANQPPAR